MLLDRKGVEKPNSCLFKWSLKLSQYDFVVDYQTGEFNVEADCLSRNPVLFHFNNEMHLKIVNLIIKQELVVHHKQSLWFSSFSNDLINCLIMGIWRGI